MKGGKARFIKTGSSLIVSCPAAKKKLELGSARASEKYTHTSPPLKLFFSPRSLSLPTRGRALGSLGRCSRGGCVSRGSMRDQWLSLTNSQRAPLISPLRDQNLRERKERGEEKEENARESERTLNFTQTRAPLVLRYICSRLVR